MLVLTAWLKSRFAVRAAQSWLYVERVEDHDLVFAKGNAGPGSPPVSNMDPVLKHFPVVKALILLQQTQDNFFHCST